MALISTKDLAKKYGLLAKKSLGQNFLFDFKITDKIAASASLIKEQNILEIGPGPAGLTRSILQHNPKKLVVIEQDYRVIPLLEEVKNHYDCQLEIIHGDALKLARENFFNGEKFTIIANLPYNIGTELLFRWLENFSQIDEMILLLQKEVVQRIVASKNSKQFGRLAVMVQFFCETKALFDIPCGAFVPAPKVTSTLVKIKPNLQPILTDIDMKILSKIVAASFSQRRKMLRSSLKCLNIDVENFLQDCSIDSSLRAEQLDLLDFGTMAKKFAGLKKNNS